MKTRLEKLGLITFCKTTGGKGLHVVTPLAVNKNDRLGWKEANAFAQAVCSQMANDSPAAIHDAFGSGFVEKEQALAGLLRWRAPAQASDREAHKDQVVIVPTAP